MFLVQLSRNRPRGEKSSSISKLVVPDAKQSEQILEPPNQAFLKSIHAFNHPAPSSHPKQHSVNSDVEEEVFGYIKKYVNISHPLY